MIDPKLASTAFEDRSGLNLDEELKGTDYMKEVQKAVNVTDFKKEQEKVFKKIVASNPADRWRLAVNWLLANNEDALFESNEIIKEIKQIRLDQKNNFAAGGVLRQGMKIPGTVLDTIYLVDPDVSAVFEAGTPTEKKKQLHKLMRIFPEYCVPKLV